MMTKAIRRVLKPVAVFLTITILTEVFAPSVAYALTGGPSQPEVQSFSPVGTSEMVNISTGDFTYNIPLMDVGGYPINITYNGGVSMDQEASWVGLGWNINPGVINRNMRGLPDDFNGDKVIKEFNIKGQKNYGVTVGAQFEIFGKKINGNKGKKIGGLGFGLGVSFNNYTGMGFELSVTPSINSGDKTKNGAVTSSLGISASSQSGVDVTPSVSFSKEVKDRDNMTKDISGKVGLAFNSREGFKALTIGGSVSSEAFKVQTGKDKFSTWGRTFESNGGASISFVSPSYTPKFDLPYFNASLSFSATLGAEIFGGHPNINIVGYYSGQFLIGDERKTPAYGYLYSQGASGFDDLQDFNREKDASFKLGTTTNLPLTNYTYDIYSVSGQGVGGAYRLFRNDVGTVYDPFGYNLGGGGSAGFEFGAAAGAHGGADISGSFSASWTEKWSGDNAMNSILRFRGNDLSDPSYEPVYFKQAGEKNSEVDMEFFNNMGGFNPVRVNLLDVGTNHYATTGWVNQDNQVVTMNKNLNRRRGRQSRNQNISYLNANEASEFALNKQIQNYPMNQHVLVNNNGVYTYQHVVISRQMTWAEHNNNHHISEMQVNRPDGARYVYGIPAYNHIQHDVTFAVENENPDCQTGLVTYNHGKENTKGNESGIDNYYDRTITPPFVHSYLLTSILSPDYSDLTGNGPSDDDLGAYTKINYSKAVSNYKWRVPFNQHTANYNEGMKSSLPGGSHTDDKATYIYGEKELWYVHSIESKTHVAEFVLENRLDGHGVKDDAGGFITDAEERANNSMKKLVMIKLFAKPDKVKYGANAVPIKVVHFEYDYSLCAGIDNNEAYLNGKNPSQVNALNKGGKLTLKKIFFTYGNSHKGRLSPYQFEYNTFNPNYNLKGYDRWGNYKENKAGSCNPFDVMSTSEFPYVEQNKALADRNTSAWSLSDIKLPSGGVIHIAYESDDYAYVQDKAAMQMFTITGTDSQTPHAGSEPDNNNPLMPPHNQSDQSNSILYFKLHKSIPASETKEGADRIVANDYIRGMQFLYFRFLVDLNKPSKEDSYEYVPGYAQIDNNQCGVVPRLYGDKYEYGWVRLKESGVRSHGGGEGVNPISKAAWQFSRFYLPRIAYEQNDPEDSGFTQFLESMASALKSMVVLFEGFNRHMRNEDFGKNFIKYKSFIRLYNPDGKKLGGGVRVKRIELSDEWQTLTGNPDYENSSYGQEYNYETTETRNGKTYTISSGVAGYEPILGGDENPWREPVFTHESKFLIPSNDYYVERPMGETFFPSPSVIYSKVTVTNLQHENVKRNATGSVVHEFYTAKDFPTITRETPLLPKRVPANAVFKALKINNNDRMTVSQGYVIELNDMHGKEKAQWVYAEGNDKPISGVEYFYKTKTATKEIFAGTQQHKVTYTSLDNEVDVISKSSGNVVQKKLVGVEFDMVADMRESRSLSISGGAHGNLEAFLAAIFPVAVPVVLPALSKEETRFRSSVITKVINRYALVSKVVAHDLGSSVATENILYDSETGEVLLTKTTNQFDDPVYNFTYPAHWAYENMGPAYKNSGLTVFNKSLDGIPDAGKYFVPGDELALISSTERKRGWVTAISGNSLTVVDRNGLPINGTFNLIKVIRSGRRNQQATPVGAITTLANPVVDINGDGKYELSFSNVINANAVEFKSEWNIYCECLTGNNPGLFNKYLNNKLGNWRPHKSYLYLTERTQERLNNNTSIRSDGVFKNFNPFWVAPATPGNWSPDRTNWTFTSEVTEFSPFGFELENKDALGRFSSALYGYNNTLPMGVANNAMYREIGFDNFEDYDYSQCLDDHFSFKAYKNENPNGEIIETESHSGRRSIQVNENKSVNVKKILIQCER